MIVAAAGAGIVFLLTMAALLNAAVSGLAIADHLRRDAVAAHLITVLLALPLGIAQLLLPKGGVRHRVLGYVWIALMIFTALVSFAVHTINPGRLGPVHLFSAGTLVSAPVIVLEARRGRIANHRRAVLGLMIGGLLVAGLFAFVPGRALGELLRALLASV